MRNKHLIMLFALLMSFSALAQKKTVVTDVIKTSTEMWLGARKVTSVTTDTSLTGVTDFMIPTALAVKRYVSLYGGGSGVTLGNKGDLTVNSTSNWTVNKSAIDSTKIKDGSLNWKDVQSSAALGTIAQWNGSQWTEAYPQYGDVSRDSFTTNTRPKYTTSTALSGSGIFEWDARQTNNLQITLTGNSGLYSPEHLAAGQQYLIVVRQDSIGGWGLSFPANVKLSDGSGIATGPYASTVFSCKTDGTDLFCQVEKFSSDEGFELLSSYYDSLEMYICPADFGKQFAEFTLGGDGRKMVTASGTVFQQYEDPSHNAHHIFSTAGRPAVGLVSGRYAWTFDGSDDMLLVRGTRFAKALQNADFTFAFWVKATSDGSDCFLFSSAADGSTSGINVRRTASNTITFTIKVSGSSVASYTTTATLTNASGWTWIQIRRSGNAGKIKVGSAAEESFTFTPQGSANGTTDMHIGEYAAGINWFAGSLSNTYWFNRYVSDAVLARFRDFNPIRPNLANMAIVRPGVFSPAKITGLDLWYDFATPSKLYTDAAGTVNVTNNNDPIRRANTKSNTYIEKHCISPGSANDPTYNTAQQAGRAASTWGSSDIMTLNTETIAADFSGAQSWFIVFKSTDTTVARRLITDGSTKGIQFTTPHVAGGRQLVPYEVCTELFRPDSFKIASEGYAAASITRKGAWNILAFLNRGGDFYLAVNNQGFVRLTKDRYSMLLNTISHASSGFIGSIGEIIRYNQFLTPEQSKMVVNWLGSRWGISVNPTLEVTPDPNRVTFIDQRSDPLVDYVAFPVCGWWGQDTLLLGYKDGPTHNDSYGATEGSKARFYKRTSTGLQQIGTTQTIFPDLLSPLRDHFAPCWTRMPDGRTLFSSTRYDGQSSPGGRDSISSVFCIRATNGTLGSVQTITHPTYNWFSVVDGIKIIGSNWYVAGYGYQGGAHYKVCILKSTNSGSSWSVIAEWDGNSLFSGTDPEEPILLQLKDGRWALFYRDDVQSKILMTTTTNIDSWNTAQSALITVGSGKARPGVWEQTDRKLVCVTRNAPNTSPELFRTVYYISTDGGKTWSPRGELDKFRSDNTGAKNMYASGVDWGSGWAAVFFGSEFGTAGILSANISLKYIKP